MSKSYGLGIQPTNMKVQVVAVIGAGTMGAGIAQVCAAIGKNVLLCDIKQEFVDNGMNLMVSPKKNLKNFPFGMVLIKVM